MEQHPTLAATMVTEELHYESTLLLYIYIYMEYYVAIYIIFIYILYILYIYIYIIYIYYIYLYIFILLYILYCHVVVVSLSRQSLCRGNLRFRSAQSTTIRLSMWSASKGSRKGGGCLDAKDHSRGNAFAQSGRFSSFTDQKFGCDRSAVELV